MEAAFNGGGAGSTKARITRTAVEAAFNGGGAGSTKARITRVAVEVAVSVPDQAPQFYPDYW